MLAPYSPVSTTMNRTRQDCESEMRFLPFRESGSTLCVRARPASIGSMCGGCYLHRLMDPTKLGQGHPAVVASMSQLLLSNRRPALGRTAVPSVEWEASFDDPRRIVIHAWNALVPAESNVQWRKNPRSCHVLAYRTRPLRTRFTTASRITAPMKETTSAAMLKSF
jgi:hypothetical protein